MGASENEISQGTETSYCTVNLATQVPAIVLVPHCMIIHEKGYLEWKSNINCTEITDTKNPEMTCSHIGMVLNPPNPVFSEK